MSYNATIILHHPKKTEPRTYGREGSEHESFGINLFFPGEEVSCTSIFVDPDPERALEFLDSLRSSVDHLSGLILRRAQERIEERLKKREGADAQRQT